MATLKQVAEQAGVSTATASLVLNGRARELKISDGCAGRVLAAAKDLGYRGNYHARTLSVGRAYTLGLALAPRQGMGLEHRLLNAVAAGVDSAAREHGNDLLLIGPRPNEPVFEHGIRCLQEKRIDALIAVGAIYDSAPESLLDVDSPVVLVEAPEGNGHPTVNMDPAPGIEEAVRHLADLGHRSILWLGKQGKGGVVLAERAEAFRRAAEEAGIEGREHFLQVESAYHPQVERLIECDREILKSCFPLPDDTTAIICFNDLMGLALYSLLNERGLRVPQDISVIGFDDLHASRAVPAMTTISHVLPEMGREAVALALEMVDGTKTGEATRGVVKKVPSRLVIRESTARPARD